MRDSHIPQRALNTTHSEHPARTYPFGALVADMIRRRVFDHIKLAHALREVMRFHQIGHSLAKRDDLTWRRLLMDLRQKDYFNHRAVVGLARLDDGPEILHFFSGFLPLSQEYDRDEDRDRTVQSMMPIDMAAGRESNHL